MRHPPRVEIPAMPAAFTLVGEHRADPDRLLLLGEDGRYYGLRLPDGATLPVEPDEAEWAVDPAPVPTDDAFA